MYGQSRAVSGIWAALLVLLAVFLGNQLGDLAAISVPALGRWWGLSLGPTTLDLLSVLTFHAGFALRINAGGALLGLLAGFLLSRRR